MSISSNGEFVNEFLFDLDFMFKLVCNVYF